MRAPGRRGRGGERENLGIESLTVLFEHSRTRCRCEGKVAPPPVWVHAVLGVVPRVPGDLVRCRAPAVV